MHFLLLAIAPVVALFEGNAHAVAPGVLALPLLALGALALSVYGAFRLVLRRPDKAALAASVAIVLFWLQVPLSGVFGRALGDTGARWTVAALLLGLLATVLAFLARTTRDFRSVNRVLDVALLAAVAITLAMGLRTASDFSTGRAQATLPVSAHPGEALPDIYVLILDAFGRADVLDGIYGIERGLADDLTDLGFCVAGSSASNYDTTLHSIPVTLNFDYVQNLITEPMAHYRRLPELVCDSALLRNLKPLGYRFVSYASGYPSTECPDADDYVATTTGLSEFQVSVLNLTPVAQLAQWWRFLSPYRGHRRRIEEILGRLADHTGDPAPTVVFAHLVSPHHPFVFGPNGEDVAPYGWRFRFSGGGIDGRRVASGERNAEYVQGYAGQARYLSRLVAASISEIIRRSVRPPVIIVQGDHGPNSTWPNLDVAERYPILNAYYLPDGGDRALYPSISPVNSFRVVLDHYFGARLPLLPDRCFRGNYRKPYEFERVSCPGSTDGSSAPTRP